MYKITFKSSAEIPQNQITPNLGWSFQTCVRQSRPPFQMAAVIKIYISLIVHCCFVI